MADRGPAARHQPAAVPAGGRRARDPVLDAARVLMLYGVVGAVAAMGRSSSRSTTPGDAQAIVGGLVLWLLGVGLLAFVPAARRFPPAAAVAAANAALGHCFAPW